MAALVNLEPGLVFFSFLGGLLPVLFWLWFWLNEDRTHPEPRSLIVLTFLLGMVSTLPALFLERVIQQMLQTEWVAILTGGLISLITLKIILWSFTEEAVKFLAASIGAFRSREYDEPVDAMIYLITAALGFSAFENMFFLVDLLQNSSIADGIITGNFRFIGATLLHVVSSSVLGVFLALTYYKKLLTKVEAIIFGIVCATGLHALFNFFIMKGQGEHIFTVFSFVWIGVIILLFAFEFVKRIHPAYSKPQ